MFTDTFQLNKIIVQHSSQQHYSIKHKKYSFKQLNTTFILLFIIFKQILSFKNFTNGIGKQLLSREIYEV